MRIIIDLQSSQLGVASDSLALAQQLAQTAGEHEVWIALNGRFSDSIDALRHAFSSLLPPERIAVYHLPAIRSENKTGWYARVAEHIRENFLATLSPDLVFIPHPFTANEIVCGNGALSAHYATVLAVSDLDKWHQPGLNDSASIDAYYRQRTTLRNASSVLLPTENMAVAMLNDANTQIVEFNDLNKLWSVFAAALSTGQVNMAKERPRLAFISPLRPQRSGIADYSAELIPELAHYYDVELIIDQPDINDPRIPLMFPRRRLEWFKEHGHEYDRILYHFGNSGAHKHMFELIQRYPGVVVLHDFFLSGVLDNLEREGYISQCFLNALYNSHGYTGLLDHVKIGRNASIWKYPVNKTVLDHASGVIVHSKFSNRLANEWYGPGTSFMWRTLPHLRSGSVELDDADARKQARRRLDLADGDFVVCSFGMLGGTKLNNELLDAFLASPLVANPRCKLVFVGENDPNTYGRDLVRRINESGIGSRICITGFVNAEIYSTWLAASDIVVQLRSRTRGETSGAVLDCLMRGIPTIINAHGSNAEIPDDVSLKLPDCFKQEQLTHALLMLHTDVALRRRLSERATAYMQEFHSPEHVGWLYVDAIEYFSHRSTHSYYRMLIDAISRLPIEKVPTNGELAEIAHAIALNQPAVSPRQLFVDVSALAQSDLKTGIQRVVRSVLLAMISAPPAGFRIEPVFSVGGNRNYCYARQFTLALVDERELHLEDAPIDFHPGDIFLGLDLFTNGTAQNQVLLQEMRDGGLKIFFVVFDLLPVLRPDLFPFGAEQHFKAYLHTLTTVSEGLIAISRSVADELSAWIALHPPRRSTSLKIDYFHLGANIDASAPSLGLPSDATQIIDSMRSRPSFLMVGTVEPRKGHAQALSAFELLWQEGVDINLVIVGKQGWMVDKIAERLKHHNERGGRLHWLQGISDEMLLKIYETSSALLAPSEGEGFGLPLIEAAQHKVPIIARNLPVFREVAGEYAFYFDGTSAEDLADNIRTWLSLKRDGNAPPSIGLPWITWNESARQLFDVIERKQWYRQLAGADNCVH